MSTAKILEALEYMGEEVNSRTNPDDRRLWAEAVAELGRLRIAAREMQRPGEMLLISRAARAEDAQAILDAIAAEDPVSVADYYEKDEEPPTAHELAESAVEEYRAMRNDPYKAPELVEEYRLAAERAVAAAKESEMKP